MHTDALYAGGLGGRLNDAQQVQRADRCSELGGEHQPGIGPLVARPQPLGRLGRLVLAQHHYDGRGEWHWAPGAVGLRLGDEQPAVHPGTGRRDLQRAGIIDSLNAQGPIGRILGLNLVLDPNISSSGGVESAFVFRSDDLMFFTSGMRAQVHQDTLATSLGILLSLWSYNGLIARYPNATIELTGFPYGS